MIMNDLRVIINNSFIKSFHGEKKKKKQLLFWSCLILRVKLDLHSTRNLPVDSQSTETPACASTIGFVACSVIGSLNEICGAAGSTQSAFFIFHKSSVKIFLKLIVNHCFKDTR